MKNNKLSHLLFCQKKGKEFDSKEKSFEIKNIINPYQKKKFLDKYVKKHNLIISKLDNFPFLIENVDYKKKTSKRSNLLKGLSAKKNTLNFRLNLNKKFITDDLRFISKIIKANRIGNKIKFLSNSSYVVLNYCGKKNAEIDYKLDFKGMTGLTFEVQNLSKLYKYCNKNYYNVTKLIHLKVINKLKIFFVRLNSGLIIEVLQKL